MRNWQTVLEEFCLAKEPMTWELPLVRLTPNEKYEAVLYLCEKGLLRQAGRVKEEHTDWTYETTPEGKLCWQLGFTDLNRRARPVNGGRTPTTDPTLAERTVRKAHRDVFDLVRLPWTYNMSAEVLGETA